MTANSNLPAIVEDARKKFELVCRDAKSLQIVNNFGAAFTAVSVVKTLRDILTDQIMDAVFMPLMNTKVGFLTDRNGRPDKNGHIKPLYTIPVVRDAIIDAISIGLSPTGNQMNIIAERMYPTKEGYTSLLKNMNVKYIASTSYDKGQNPNFAEIPVKIDYEHNGEKNSLSIIATVKKDAYSSHDQLRGKAERRAKKALYEYLTGQDFGDADEGSSSPIDIPYEDVTNSKSQSQTADIMGKLNALKEKKDAEKPKDQKAEPKSPSVNNGASTDVIKVHSYAEAKQFLVSNFGVSEDVLTTQRQVIEVAKEAGFEIEILPKTN